MDGLVQERRKAIANAKELRLSCTDQSTYTRLWIGSSLVQVMA